MIEETNADGTMHRDDIPGIYPERSRRKLAPKSGNALFASRMDLRDYYAYARYYSPRLGRFMSPDPLGGDILNPQSLNRYTYVLNNPETFIDPLGMDAHRCIVGIDAGTELPIWGYCTTTTYQFTGVGGLKEAYFSFFPEATGMNGCLGWCPPTPPSDTFAYSLFQKLEKRLRALRYRLKTLKLQTISVAQGAGQNFVNEFKNGGCVADFSDRAAGAPGPAPTGPQPNDLAEAAGTGWAWWYAAENTLSVPLRSSTYRGILDAAETAAGTAAAGLLDYFTATAFYGEMKDLSSGACR